MGAIPGVLLGYLVGSIPMGLILGKALKGIDIREYGSGKIGTANVARSLGIKAGLFILLFDMGKGVAAVYIGRALGDGDWAVIACAMAAVAGHNWSVFLRFSGGRGVSTGLGAFIALVPIVGALALAFGLAVIAVSRFISLGSIAGALFASLALLPLAAVGREPWAYFLYAAIISGIIVYQHRDNIGRLRRGEERRFGQKAERRGPATSKDALGTGAG